MGQLFNPKEMKQNNKMEGVEDNGKFESINNEYNLCPNDITLKKNKGKKWSINKVFYHYQFKKYENAKIRV